MQRHVALFDGHDIGYEFVLRDASHVRADVINMTTQSLEDINLYTESGGSNADPVLENIASRDHPIFIDLEYACKDKNSRTYGNKYLKKMLASNRPYLSSFPFSDDGGIGHGAITIIDTQPPAVRIKQASELSQIGLQLHRALRRAGLYRKFFRLTEKELSTLLLIACGQTAEDIAEKIELSSRAIEMRLGKARKKLKARTTTEAVYKAAVYGLI